MNTSRKLKPLTTSVSLTFLLLFLTGCTPQPLTFQGSALGTNVQFTLYGTQNPEIPTEILRILNDIEDKMTIWEHGKTSELMLLNQTAGQQPLPVSPQTLAVLETALHVARLSGGALNPAIGPLVKAWGFISYAPSKPAEDEIRRLLPLTQWQDIQITPEGVYLARKGMIVDLGAVAKGYAADQVKLYLESVGVTSGIIDIGGNILTLGIKPSGQPWRAGIQEPGAPRGQYLGVLSLNSKTLVTSGDYEKFFMDNGVRYHHILDPKTGFPAQSGLHSVTIVAESSVLADALSTACFVLGLEGSLELLSHFHGVEALFVLEDKTLYLTPLLRPHFENTGGYRMKEEVK